MSSSNAEGGLRRSPRNKKPNDNIERLQNLAESGSGVTQTKATAADAQVSFIQPGSSKNTGVPTTNQSQSVQSQSKPPYNTQEEQPSPDGTGEAAPDEPKDQHMGDAESERRPPEYGTPSPIGANDSSGSSDEVLTDLKKLSIGRDHDGEPDVLPAGFLQGTEGERTKRERTREPSMPSAQSLEQGLEGWRPGSRQSAVNNTQRLDSVSVMQESSDEDDEDNDLFVDDFSTNARNASGQNTSGQDSNGPNNNGLNNGMRSGPGQNRPPPKLSKFYKRCIHCEI